LKEPRVCVRTKKLVETLPLDSEISCDLHPKETAMHYDHSLKKFICLQCARLTQLADMPEVVETDRNVLMKSLHVLYELLDKRMMEIKSAMDGIKLYRDMPTADYNIKGSEFLELC
jgi:hypothetical protein